MLLLLLLRGGGWEWAEVEVDRKWVPLLVPVLGLVLKLNGGGVCCRVFVEGCMWCPC